MQERHTWQLFCVSVWMKHLRKEKPQSPSYLLHPWQYQKHVPFPCELCFQRMAEYIAGPQKGGKMRKKTCQIYFHAKETHNHLTTKLEQGRKGSTCITTFKYDRGTYNWIFKKSLQHKTTQCMHFITHSPLPTRLRLAAKIIIKKKNPRDNALGGLWRRTKCFRKWLTTLQKDMNWNNWHYQETSQINNIIIPWTWFS